MFKLFALISTFWRKLFGKRDDVQSIDSLFQELQEYTIIDLTVNKIVGGKTFIEGVNKYKEYITLIETKNYDYFSTVEIIYKAGKERFIITKPLLQEYKLTL